MTKTAKQPTNLIEAVRYFSDLDRCHAFVKNLRWPDGKTICSHCGADKPYYVSTRRIWKCRQCRRQFSLKTGTIFEDSPLGFDKWLPAMWLIVNSKNGISSYELARSIGVTQKTAWFMNHRIRLAMQSGSWERVTGTIEVDETYVGGLSKNMHESKRASRINGTGGFDKIAIQGGRSRDTGNVAAVIIERANKATFIANVSDWAEPGSTVYTDKHPAIRSLDGDFDYSHKTVNHQVEHVSGDVHTNGIENFWSLFKRAWKGTYTHMDPKHASRYLDERVFTYNERHSTDLGRMIAAVSQIVGRHTTYAELKGA